MNVRICDNCSAQISSNAASFTVTRVNDEPHDSDMCSAACLRDFVNHHWPERRPDFVEARRVLTEAGQLSTLPVPVTAGQRITADELAEVHEYDALDNDIDSGRLDDDQPLFEGDPIATIIDGLPRGRRSHSMLAADAALALRKDGA